MSQIIGIGVLNMNCEECQTKCEYDNLSISKHNKHFDEIDGEKQVSIKKIIETGA